MCATVRRQGNYFAKAWKGRNHLIAADYILKHAIVDRQMESKGGEGENENKSESEFSEREEQTVNNKAFAMVKYIYTAFTGGNARKGKG